jgi:(E)-4-hydroxy-3-methylbut-2-enyl-diphosphate synthase
MQIKRRKTRIVKIGSVAIGGDNPIAIQSMTKTATRDVENTVKEIKNLSSRGCDIVRVAVKDHCDAAAIREIKKNITIPLVADIHFDWRLALQAIDSRADKIRLNPGNIFKSAQVKEVARAAKLAGIPIRVGLNSGSIGTSRKQVDKMIRAAKKYIEILESVKFKDIVISLKASNICDTVDAYRKMARICDYPFHLGLTATGVPYRGIIKSSVAIGSLLLDGIGDTIRISLTDKSEEEVKSAQCILESLGLRNYGPQIISCPTCGRCEVNLVKLVKELEYKLSVSRLTSFQTKPLKVAVMGCVVNGPGEAGDADLGVAFGKKEGLLFKGGKPLRKVSFRDCAAVLLKEMRRMND